MYQKMSFVQTRKISFESIKSIFRRTTVTPATDLLKPLTSLPNATGTGVFSEPVSYQVLGSSHNLLNIKLPKSSILNIRYSNLQQRIVAMNGRISSMYTELTKQSESNIIYQRCFNQTEPMSLLIAQNSENSNFAVVEVNKSNWLVKRNSLFAWSGPSMKPYAKKNSKIVFMKGEGSFVISSPGQIMQMKLEENESIRINSNVIIGYTSEAKSFDELVDNVQKSAKSVTNLGVGKVPMTLKAGWLTKHISLPPQVTDDPTIRKICSAITKVLLSLKAVGSFIKKSVAKVSHNEVFVEIKGPKTVLISNSVHVNDQVLTEEQIFNLTH